MTADNNNSHMHFFLSIAKEYCRGSRRTNIRLQILLVQVLKERERETSTSHAGRGVIVRQVRGWRRISPSFSLSKVCLLEVWLFERGHCFILFSPKKMTSKQDKEPKKKMKQEDEDGNDSRRMLLERARETKKIHAIFMVIQEITVRGRASSWINYRFLRENHTEKEKKRRQISSSYPAWLYRERHRKDESSAHVLCLFQSKYFRHSHLSRKQRRNQDDKKTKRNTKTKKKEDPMSRG